MRTKKVLLKPSSNPLYGNIRLQITENRIPTTISLNEKILVKDWDETKQQVKRSNKEYQRINERIDDFIKKYYYDNYTPPNKNSLIQYIKKLNKDVFNHGTRGGKNSKLKVLMEFLEEKEKKKDLKYSEFDNDLVKRFYNYLLQTKRSKNHTVRIIRELKFIYNKLVNEEGITFKKNPFLGLDTKEVYDNNKSLTIEELNKIIENPIPKSDKTINIYNHRNYFLFQVYSMGMRIRDVLFLRWNQIEDERIVYTMSKTKKKISYLLLENIVKIIVQYSPYYKHDTVYHFSNDGKIYDGEGEEIKPSKTLNKTIELNFVLEGVEWIDSPMSGLSSIGFNFDLDTIEGAHVMAA
jgi:integrase/recombinase XerD